MGLGEIETARLQVLLHHREHLHQAVGIIADAPEERHGGPVRLVFGRAGIAVVDQGVGDVGDRAAEGLRECGDFPGPEGLGAFRRDGGQGLGDPRLLDGLHPVPELDVPDLVGQDRREGVFIPAAAQQPPRHEDQAARRGEGVDVVGIQDEEMVAPEDGRQIRRLGQGLAEDVHILVDLARCRKAGYFARTTAPTERPM